MSDTTDTATPDAPPLEYTIELRKPISFGGGTITEMRLRPPTGGEVRIAKEAVRKELNTATMYKSQMVLLSKVTGIAEPALDNVDMDQLNDALEYLGYFLDASPRTSWKSQAS